MGREHLRHEAAAPVLPAPQTDDLTADDGEMNGEMNDVAQLPSARAQKTLARGLFAIRATFGLQLVLALPHGFARATQPSLYLTMSLTAIGAIALIAWALLRRGYLTRMLAITDVTIAATLIISEVAFVAPADRTGTWVAWGFAYAVVGTIHAAAADYGWRLTLVGTVVLMIAYAAEGDPWAATSTARWALVINLVALGGFAIATRYICRYILEAAAVAEAMLSTVAASVAREVSVRTASTYRATLHDMSGALGLLTQELSPAQRDLVTPHAKRIAEEARSLLMVDAAMPAGTTTRTTAGTTAGAECEIAALIRQAVATDERGGTEPRLRLEVDDAAGVCVPARQGGPLVAAVRTLVGNVYQHAHAASAVVTATRTTTGWAVTVADDGVGFDPGHAQYRYGLTHQAGSDLRREGIDVVVDSAPGRGTRITLSGTGHAAPAGGGR